MDKTVAVFFFAAGLNKGTDVETKEFAQKAFDKGLKEGKIKPVIVEEEVAEMIYSLLGIFERDN